MGPHVDRHGVHLTDFIDEIMGSAEFQETMAELAVELNRNEDDIRKECKDDFGEIAAEQHEWAISTWDAACRWLGRAYQLDVDYRQVEKIAKLNKKSTLVFLPNHRSYLDAMILRSALEEYGFPPNHVIGGVNLAFFPMGSIARRNGTVFIRREFKNDVVYKACLKAYMAYLVANHANLEWYIEGGRTRTGKLRPPRMGMLSYLVDAFDVDGDEDVTIIPVFVGYDQQYEVEAISAEEQGGTKAPESISWLISFVNAQRVRRGRAHLRFGEPLSLRQAIADTRAKEETDDARVAVPKIAFEVMHRINKATPIMPSALVTFAILDNDDKAITMDQARNILRPLLKYLRKRKLDLSENINLDDYGGLYDALRTLEREGVVRRYSGGLEDVAWIAEDRAHEAGFYRNTLIHHLTTRAIVEISLVKVSEDNPVDVAQAAWEQALQLRDLLKYEFFFPRKGHFAAEVERECDLAYPGWETKQFKASEVLPRIEKSGLMVAHRSLGPFIEAYWMLADRLAAQDPRTEIDQEELVLETIGVAQQRFYQGALHSPESISKDLFTNALKLAGNRGLLDPGGRAVAKARKDFAAEIADVVRRVEVIRDMARIKEGL